MLPEKIDSHTFWGLDLDSRLLHIMLVLWLSVGLLCTDMQCLRNQPWEFWLIYSKSWTTSKILSCRLVLNAPFVCSFLLEKKFDYQNAALDIGNLIRLGESRAHSGTIGNVLGLPFFVVDDEGKQYWTCNSHVDLDLCGGYFLCHLCHLKYADQYVYSVNLNTWYTMYFSSVWFSPIIYWSIVIPSSFQPPSFEDA